MVCFTEAKKLLLLSPEEHISLMDESSVILESFLPCRYEGNFAPNKKICSIEGISSSTVIFETFFIPSDIANVFKNNILLFSDSGSIEWLKKNKYLFSIE